MASVRLLPSSSHGPGTISIPSVAIPLGVMFLTVEVDRAGMASGTLRVNWGIEVSQDGGATWAGGGGGGLAGGVVIDPDTSLPFPVSSFSVALANSANPARRLRGSITLNEAVTTSVTLVTGP